MEDFEGMVDLSEMLNNAPEDTQDTTSREKPSSGAAKEWDGLDGEESDGRDDEDMTDDDDDDDEDVNDEEEDVLAPSDEDDVENGELDALEGLIERLPVGKRKADDEDDEQPNRKRRLLERTEVIPEGEYGAPARSGAYHQSSLRLKHLD